MPFKNLDLEFLNNNHVYVTQTLGPHLRILSLITVLLKPFNIPLKNMQN